MGIFVLIQVMTYSQSTARPTSFEAVKQVRNYIFEEEFEFEDEQFMKHYADIYTVDDWWNFLRGPFFKSTHPPGVIVFSILLTLYFCNVTVSQRFILNVERNRLMTGILIIMSGSCLVAFAFVKSVLARALALVKRCTHMSSGSQSALDPLPATMK